MLDPGIVQDRRRRRRGRGRSAFAIFVVDDNACTRCSVCVERCPSDTLYYARLPEEVPAASARWPRFPRRRQASSRADYRERTRALKLREAEASLAQRRWATGPGDRGLEVDVPARFDLPQGLQGHLARPRPRDDEQRAVPPAPGEGEAARVEADLHVLPGRPVVLPVHPAHDHGHLPDVLLPAHGRRRRRHRLRATCRASAPPCSSATWSATSIDGAPTSWCSRVSLHMARVFYTGAYKPPREFNWVVGRDPAVPDPGTVVHRVPAAVGPAVDLGGHRGHLAGRATRPSSPSRRSSCCWAASWSARTRCSAGTSSTSWPCRSYW